jgi:hypothetical protein
MHPFCDFEDVTMIAFLEILKVDHWPKHLCGKIWFLLSGPIVLFLSSYRCAFAANKISGILKVDWLKH